MIDIREILNTLGEQRPIFHSEADFQHAFAWEIHVKYLDAIVRLEYPIRISKENIFLDLWIILDNVIYAIELKYKTRKMELTLNNEIFALKDQSAQDIGRYDFIKDIGRLEGLKKNHSNFLGYAIFLTNDSSYWGGEPNLKVNDYQFRLWPERSLTGRLEWGERASTGTKLNREKALELHGKYQIQWKPFPKPNDKRFGEFRYLLINV